MIMTLFIAEHTPITSLFGEKGVKYPKLPVNDYEMYSPDAIIDAIDLVNALKQKVQKT